MGWIIAEIFVKILGAIECLILLPIAIIIAGVMTLIHGIRDGYWHRDTWAVDFPKLLRDLWGWFKSPVFD